MNEDSKNINQSSSPKSKGGFSFGLSWLFFLAMLLGGYYFVAQRMDAEETKIAEALQKIAKLEKDNQRLHSVTEKLEDELTKAQLTKSDNWQPVVIEHLVRMADLTLKTTGNSEKVVMFLETAKKYAKGLKFSSINYALNEDIAKLQALGKTNLSSLLLKVKELGGKINMLPLATTEFKKSRVAKPLEQEESAKPLSLWQRLFISTKEALKNIVELKERSDISPLLPKDQEELLRLNIQTKFSQAEIAITNQQEVLYIASLKEIEEMIKKYFSLNQEAGGIIAEIKDLRKKDLKLTRTISLNSLAVINRYLRGKPTNSSSKGAKKS